MTMPETRNQALIQAMHEDRALQVTVVAETLPPEAPPYQPAASNARLPLDGNELLVTIVIPSIVIALALVLSALIACVLYQKMRQSRRRRCRAAAGSSRVYVKKGVPVIFAEELDERAATAHDTPSHPLILPAEMLDARCAMPNAAYIGTSKH